MTSNQVSGTIVLSGDIGGTNANLGIIGFKERIPKILLSKRYETDSANDLSELLIAFLEHAKKTKFEPIEGCLAVAGPIEYVDRHQRVKMTNTNLIIDSKDLIKKTSLKNVLIINDFEAISYAINVLGEKDFVTIHKGQAVPKGVRVVIGAGTGLGKCILCFDEFTQAYLPIPSEGGHSDVPLFNEEELKLAQFIKRKKQIRNEVSYEDVLSGRGLENIYEYLAATRFENMPKYLSAQEISRTKTNNQCSKETFDWFIKFYARCARNFVLDTLAKGGLYLAGGIAGKNIDSFSQFMEEFILHEEYTNILKNISVHIIINYDVGMTGAAYALIVQKLLEAKSFVK